MVVDQLQVELNEFVLIHEKKVVKFFKEELEAIACGEKLFGRETPFLVQQCVDQIPELRLSAPSSSSDDFFI